MFYPAGTSYALAEETYRLGLYATLQHREPAADLRRRVRRQGHVASCPRSTHRCSTPTTGRSVPSDAPSHRLRLRAAGPLAQLLGAGVPRAATS